MPRLNAQALLALPYEEMVEVIRRWTRKNMADTQCWNFWRRDNQAAPLEDWRIWLVMAGRGYGKTRMGAEWVSALAAQHAGARFALVGATLNEARAVMVEGESGLLALPYADFGNMSVGTCRLRQPSCCPGRRRGAEFCPQHRHCG